MKSLASSRCNEAEDIVSALREDPGYFSISLKKIFEHLGRLFKAQPGGNVVPLTSSDRTAADVFADAADQFVRSKLADIERWSLMSRCMERLHAVHKNYFVNQGIAAGEAMPEELASVLEQTNELIGGMVSDILEPFLEQVMFSPAVRAYIRLPTGQASGGITTCPNMPAPIERLTTILTRFDSHWRRNPMGIVNCIELLLDEIDHFYNDPSAHKTVSSFIAAKISDLSLIAEIVRQLEWFPPNSFECIQSIKVDAIWLMAYSMANKDARAFLTKLKTPFSRRTAKRVVVSMMNVSYPVEKRRSKETVQVMQAAEFALDELWKAIIGDANRRQALSKRCQKILDREPYRTPQWEEPPPPSSESPATKSTGLSANLQAFHSNDQFHAFTPRPTRKTKPKTRRKLPIGGTTEATTQPATQRTVTNNKAQVIKVDARSLQVLKTIFIVSSTASQPGEVAWVHFLHAMRNVGFAIEKLGGSAWRFTPAESLSTDCDLRRSICFHEPHPGSKLPVWMARRNERRLQRAYGWDAATFALE